MKKQIIALLILAFLFSPIAWSQERQSHAEIHKVAISFLQQITHSMPGKITLKVDAIDSRLTFPPCPQLEAFMPTGAQMQGRTSIGVRCNKQNGWSIYIPATITVTMDQLISSRPLRQGQIIDSGDFRTQAGALTQVGTITKESQVLGKVLKYSISGGQLLRQNMFRAPYAVTQGQTVQLIAKGRGIKLRSKGKALNNAAEGESARVKVASGQIISGTAKENGIVEVHP